MCDCVSLKEGEKYGPGASSSLLPEWFKHIAQKRFQDWLNRENLPIKNIEKAGDTSVADTDVFMRQSRVSFKETITVRDVRRLLSGGWLMSDYHQLLSDVIKFLELWGLRRETWC